MLAAGRAEGPWVCGQALDRPQLAGPVGRRRNGPFGPWRGPREGRVLSEGVRFVGRPIGVTRLCGSAVTTRGDSLRFSQHIR